MPDRAAQRDDSSSVNQEDKIVSLLLNYKTDNDNEIAKLKMKTQTLKQLVRQHYQQLESRRNEVAKYQEQIKELEIQKNASKDKNEQHNLKEQIRKKGRDKEGKTEEMKKIEDDIEKDQEGIKDAGHLELQVIYCNFS